MVRTCGCAWAGGRESGRGVPEDDLHRYSIKTGVDALVGKVRDCSPESTMAMRPTRNGSDVGRSLLDEIVRDGARAGWPLRLRAEVAAYIEQFADQRSEDCHRLVVRGYHQAP